MDPFRRIERLPPYVFSTVNELKTKLRAEGADIVDFGMGNPDLPPAAHIIDKLVDTVRRKDTHRYSESRGIPRLRQAICDWYRRRFDVELDPDSEAIVTIGSKEGLAHLMLATLSAGDHVLVPNPAYPIHPYGCVIADADVHYVPMTPETDFFERLTRSIHDTWPRPKMLILNFPSNPTTHCVDSNFFTRVVEVAAEYGIWVVHDIAYAELVYDGYVAPSILQVPGARDVAVEFYSLSKTYNMPGWRIGFMCGNPVLVKALSRMKSYLDYGLFTPLQIAAVTALDGPQDCVDEVRGTYRKRRDVLCDSLCAAGWQVEKPKATMFVWAEIPEAWRERGSLEFSKHLMKDAGVAVSPGMAFGKYGEGFVRFSLIENEQRIRQAARNIKRMLRSA